MKNLWLAMAPTLRQDGLFHGKSQQHLRVFMNGTLNYHPFIDGIFHYYFGDPPNGGLTGVPP